GRVTLIMGQVEMGQGMYTAMPQLLAEELEVGLDQVRLEHAPPDEKRHANPLFHFQATGGSTSVMGLYEPMRRAGATARTMLIAAAAERWQVDPGTCHGERSAVIHAPSRRRLGYGALAARAAELPIPDNVALKRPEDFKLIGRSAKRLDSPAKVNGTAQYSIDVGLPGMKIATVAASPVLGGKVADGGEARGSVRGAVPRPCGDGADQLHGARAAGPLRGVDRLAGPGARAGDGRPGRRPAARQGRGTQPSVGRRVRSAPRTRLRHPGR